MDYLQNKSGTFYKCLSSPIIVSIIIVSIIILIIFSIAAKYFRRGNNYKKLIKATAYSLLVTCGMVFLHDKILEEKLEENIEDNELKNLVALPIRSDENDDLFIS
jgi:hypothetical protein